MLLEQRIAKYIREEAEKLIERYNLYHNVVHVEYTRNKKRLGNCCPNKEIKTPDYWQIDNKFNPFYVRKKYKAIAKSITQKIISREYKPNKPHILQVPKSDGTTRDVTIFQIQDAAISKMYFDKLLTKNKHRFSSFSYAYRNDRNVHFAIQDIFVDFHNHNRMFIAEFDFSKFFPSISQTFLRDQFNKNGFNISKEEEFIIESFLSIDFNNGVGIPQGTSLSLFLANLSCWYIDKELEKLGVKFARYADDTLIWSSDYTKTNAACIIINNFAKTSGVKINVKKSAGVSLITQTNLSAEIKQSDYVDFLGYSVTIENIRIKKASLKKIQHQVSYLLYRNLIQPFKQINILNHNMSTKIAIVTAIMQIRRYIYGGLTDKHLKDYISGRISKIYFKGIMSFYPLVNDEVQLQELDGWMVSTIFRTLKLHKKLVHKTDLDIDNIKNNNELIEFLRSQKINISKKIDLEIPSFMRIYRAINKGIAEFGIEGIMNPKSLNYDY